MSTLVPQIDWKYKAACRTPGMSAIFYPPPEQEKRQAKLKREEQAIRVCQTCPVIEECLDHALRKDENLGIWGGKTEEERKAILLRRNSRDFYGDD